jgi:uncharacterized protein YwlG (UPF0340 family)
MEVKDMNIWTESKRENGKLVITELDFYSNDKGMFVILQTCNGKNHVVALSPKEMDSMVFAYQIQKNQVLASV